MFIFCFISWIFSSSILFHSFFFSFFCFQETIHFWHLFLFHWHCYCCCTSSSVIEKKTDNWFSKYFIQRQVIHYSFNAIRVFQVFYFTRYSNFGFSSTENFFPLFLLILSWTNYHITKVSKSLFALNFFYTYYLQMPNSLCSLNNFNRTLFVNHDDSCCC